jgi:putative nucleotidyltransferase with HDIG domain
MGLKAEDCLEILKKHNVPQHIVEHSQVVHRIALFLCRTLNRQGKNLDEEKVVAGALLHDIAKIDGLEQGKNHSQAGAELLTAMGYPEIGEIIRQHVVLDDASPQAPITEATIVHYADKRVKHTSIVSLERRFEDLKARYGKNPPALAWLEEMERRAKELEKRIFEKLPLTPETLNSVALDPPPCPVEEKE